MAEKQQKENKKVAENKFVHLHVHTHYSLLDGMCKIPKLLDRAKDYGMGACAITDHGVMYGAIEFYKEAKKRDIQPIIGCEMYVAPRTLHDKEARVDSKAGHLVLLTKNKVGYQNLIKLVTIAHVDGYYYKPRIDHETLKEHSEGLIALSACLHGEISQKIVAKENKKAEELLKFYVDTFGEDFYIELQYHPGMKEQEDVNKKLVELAKKHSVGLVATKDVHYVDKEDHEAHDALICVQTGKLMDDETRGMKFDGDLSFIAPVEMVEYFKETPEAIGNTVKIAEKCKPFLEEFRLPYAEEGKFFFPKYEIPDGFTTKTYFEKLIEDGLQQKYKEITKEVRERTDYEIKIIQGMGYDEYFLVVADYVNWAKQNGILVGPGRGSGAGSIVAFAMGITDLDPLYYNLLFERFLNPERISMPDFDVDFADDRRHEVVEYVVRKYGKEKVAQIITFGTMAARNAVRDTGRVLGMSYAEVDEVAKVIPQGEPLERSVKEAPELAEFYKRGGNYKRLLDLAQRLEGVARHSSTHAAGVVISREDLTNYTPLQRATKGDISTNTQYEMHAVEDLGLLKMDFLGLSNLTIIKNALRIIKKVYDVEVNLENLVIDDKKAYQLLAKGETTGVFQLESGGMKRYLKELKPTVFEDIISMVALYRPGPMDSIPDFIAAKHGRKEITYLHPKLEPILEDTYGVIVTQDQVLQIARHFSGFTYGQADVLRKAVGKKIKKLLDEQKEKFVKGAIDQGADKKTAVAVWDFIEPFARYGFNRAHAACYAMIAYWTAYLKAHYPAAFMAALMTSDYSDIDRITIEVSECKSAGIEVLGPDVNESFAEFGVVKETNQIRFGLMAVKNVGMGIIDAIVAARKEGGRFASLEDFCTRVKASEINKKVIESLIKCGAFDSMGDRSTFLYNLEKILNFAQKVQKGTANGQLGLFGENTTQKAVTFQLLLDEPDRPLTVEEKLGFERELLGIYFSEHPLDQYEEKIKDLNLKPIVEIMATDSGKDVRLGGVITSLHKILTRKNDPMVFATFEDKTATTELIVFPKTLVEYAQFIEEGKVLFVKGKINNKDGQLKILVDSMEELKGKTVDRKRPKVNFVERGDDVTIKIPDGVTDTDLTALKLLLAKNKGEVDTYVLLPNGGLPKKVKMPFGIDFDDNLIGEVNALLARRA